MIQRDTVQIQVLHNTGVDTDKNKTEGYGTDTGATQYECRHKDEVIERDTVQIQVLHNMSVDTEKK